MLLTRYFAVKERNIRNNTQFNGTHNGITGLAAAIERRLRTQLS